MAAISGSATAIVAAVALLLLPPWRPSMHFVSGLADHRRDGVLAVAPPTNARISPEQLAAAATAALDISTFHAASEDGRARVELLQTLYQASAEQTSHADATATALERFAEQTAVSGSCSSSSHEEDRARADEHLTVAHKGLRQLQRFAAAVRRHLPPRDADALAVVVVGAGPAGLLTAVEASVRFLTHVPNDLSSCANPVSW